MDKEQTAIERLRTASEMSIKHYGTPLAVTTSGGKDSAICIALAERAGIPFEATPISIPDKVRYLAQMFCGISFSLRLTLMPSSLSLFICGDYRMGAMNGNLF